MSTDENECFPIYVDNDGTPVYNIHMEDDKAGHVPDTFMLPENLDGTMNFIQEVAQNTQCEIRVYCRISIKQGTDVKIPAGYYRHSGPKEFVPGRGWVYKLRRWRAM